MATRIVLAIVLLACVKLSTQNQCSPNPTDPRDYWKDQDLQQQCLIKFRNQIQMELEASITYLAMGAHFSHAKTHRPNAAKFFLESAGEERSHAKKLIEYLLMRGGELTKSTIGTITQGQTEWDSLENALDSALELEHKVTQSIKDIIKVCGAEPVELEAGKGKDTAPVNSKDTQKNDYQAVDYLTSEFLKEQHEGTRQLAGYLKTLVKMQTQYGNFAEIIFDKSLAA